MHLQIHYWLLRVAGKNHGWLNSFSTSNEFIFILFVLLEHLHHSIWIGQLGRCKCGELIENKCFGQGGYCRYNSPYILHTWAWIDVWAYHVHVNVCAYGETVTWPESWAGPERDLVYLKVYITHKFIRSETGIYMYHVIHIGLNKIEVASA